MTKRATRREIEVVFERCVGQLISACFRIDGLDARGYLSGVLGSNDIDSIAGSLRTARWLGLRKPIAVWAILWLYDTYLSASQGDTLTVDRLDGVANSIMEGLK